MYKPGDRKCTCHGRMKPIALTYKPQKNVFARNTTFELMLVHECTSCGAFSKNRISGDDSDYSIERVYLESFNLPNEKIKKLRQQGIDILDSNDYDVVMTSLYGISMN